MVEDSKLSSNQVEQTITHPKQTSVKEQRLYILFFAMIVLQTITLLWIFSFRAQNADARQGFSQTHVWWTWEKMGDEALQEGNKKEAIYFYEKLAKEMPESPAKIKIQDKLSRLYHGMRESNKEEKVLLLDSKTPALYLAAEQKYNEGDYIEARKLFYQFLLLADHDEEHRNLFFHAYLRIQQCLLQDHVKESKEDIVVSRGLEIVKK